MTGHFKRLAYIYVGCEDFEKDKKFYGEALGARLVWEFHEFGANVAAFDLGGEPYVLIADHVKPPSKRLVYEVDDLTKAIKELKSRGWKPDGSRFEVPDGPCVNFKDPSGNEYALMEAVRPHILEGEFRKPR